MSEGRIVGKSREYLGMTEDRTVKLPVDYQNPQDLYDALITRVRKYHPSTDISMIEKAFRIADEAELTLIKSDVLSELLEEQYEESSEEFLEFVESYASTKSDAVLEDFILRLHNFSMSYPWPEEWLITILLLS